MSVPFNALRRLYRHPVAHALAAAPTSVTLAVLVVLAAWEGAWSVGSLGAGYGVRVEGLGRVSVLAFTLACGLHVLRMRRVVLYSGLRRALLVNAPFVHAGLGIVLLVVPGLFYAAAQGIGLRTLRSSAAVETDLRALAQGGTSGTILRAGMGGLSNPNPDGTWSLIALESIDEEIPGAQALSGEISLDEVFAILDEYGQHTSGGAERIRRWIAAEEQTCGPGIARRHVENVFLQRALYCWHEGDVIPLFDPDTIVEGRASTLQRRADGCWDPELREVPTIGWCERAATELGSMGVSFNDASQALAFVPDDPPLRHLEHLAVAHGLVRSSQTYGILGVVRALAFAMSLLSVLSFWVPLRLDLRGATTWGVLVAVAAYLVLAGVAFGVIDAGVPVEFYYLYATSSRTSVPLVVVAVVLPWLILSALLTRTRTEGRDFMVSVGMATVPISVIVVFLVGVAALSENVGVAISVAVRESTGGRVGSAPWDTTGGGFHALWLGALFAVLVGLFLHLAVGRYRRLPSDR